jgi:hypothetical protein
MGGISGRWRLSLLLVGVLACASLAQTAQGHVLLADVGLYEKPATYTELAFSQPTALQNALNEPGGDVQVSFGIHNVSGDAQSYQWSVAVVDSGKSQVKASGTAQVPGQGRTSVDRSVAVACPSGQTEVTVRLAAPAESISFWLKCQPASGAKQGK